MLKFENYLKHKNYKLYNLLEKKDDEEESDQQDDSENDDEELSDEGFSFEEEDTAEDTEQPEAQDEEYKIGFINKDKVKKNSNINIKLYKLTQSEIEEFAEDYSFNKDKVIESIKKEDTDTKIAQKLSKAIKNSELGNWYKTIKVKIDNQYNIYSDPDLLDVIFIYYNK